MVCLLQFPGSSTGTVCLEATLRPSAALHIWQAYHQANLSGANVAYLAATWEGVTGEFVMACRRQAGQPSTLQTAAAVQAANPSLAMFDTNRLGTTRATYLPAVQDAVRPLLQLTQVLLSQSGFLLSCDYPEHQLEILQRLSGDDRIDKAPKDTDLTSNHAAHQERRIVLLQSMLLLLKLVTFMSTVEAKSPSADVAKEVLWQSLSYSYLKQRLTALGLQAIQLQLPHSMTWRRKAMSLLPWQRCCARPCVSTSCNPPFMLTSAVA